MDTWVFISVAAPAGLALMWGVAAYNRFVRDRCLVREAWSGVDVQLKRRHDLVPMLAEIVRGYAAHEKSTLDRATQLRATALGGASVAQRQAAEAELTGLLHGVLAVAEAYPALKANRSFLDLQGQLVAVEEDIQLARRYYNGTVRNYNTRIQSFPGNIVAGLFRFQPVEFFQIATATQRDAPKVEMPG